MVYGSLVQSNIRLELYWDLVMNVLIVLIKLQLNDFLFFLQLKLSRWMVSR